MTDALNVDELAELFGVTPKCIRDWIVEGLPVVKRGARGRGRNRTLVSLRAAVAWYFTEKLFDDQRQRLAAAQAEKVEHENAVRRGELARKDDVVRFWVECVANARARLLRLPSDVSRGAPADLRGQVQIAAQTAVHEALQELAEYEPQ